MLPSVRLDALCCALLVLVAGTTNSVAQSDPTLGYLFNETGNSAPADGSAADASGNPQLQFIDNSGNPADLHGPAGSGVSGNPADRSFNNVGSSGILSASRGQHAADFDPIDAFSAFTLGGWFRLPDNADESLGRQAAIIENGTISVLDAPGGYRLRGGATANAGTLELTVNRDERVESSAVYTEIGSWINFAVSYDGTATTDNVRFYKGTIDQPLTLVEVLTLNAGVVLDEAIPLTVGATRTSGLTLNPFSGELDNLRIWDFVVDETALEALRQSDINAVPEPSTFSLLGIAVGLLFARRLVSQARVGSRDRG